MNAKVDYTLLDRWRHSHEWWARKRVERDTASVVRANADPSGGPRQDEHDETSARVVHLPLAD